MNYEHLEYFVVAAEVEHFIKASEKLNITQSTLSRAIRNLEEELDVPLFLKVGRNVKLTAFGKVFYQHVKDALHMIEIGVDETRKMANNISGGICIHSIYAYSHSKLPVYMYEFTKQYPGINFTNYQFPSREIIKHIINGEAEIGFCSGYIDFEKEYPQVNSEVILKEEVVMIVPKSHPLAERETVTINDIANETFITFTPNSGFHYLSEKLFKEAGVKFPISISVTDDATVCTFVENNLGVAFMGIDTAKQYENVHIHKLNYDNAVRYMHMVWKKESFLSAAANLFMDYVRSKVQYDAKV